MAVGSFQTTHGTLWLGIPVAFTASAPVMILFRACEIHSFLLLAAALCLFPSCTSAATYCDACGQGLSTAAEGSTSLDNCNLAARGHFLQLQDSAAFPPTPPSNSSLVFTSTVNTTTGEIVRQVFSAEPCPANTYQDTENNATCEEAQHCAIATGRAFYPLSLCSRRCRLCMLNDFAPALSGCVAIVQRTQQICAGNLEIVVADAA